MSDQTQPQAQTTDTGAPASSPDVQVNEPTGDVNVDQAPAAAPTPAAPTPDSGNGNQDT